MILPERVLGSPGANWTRSGDAIGPISLRTRPTSSFFKALAWRFPGIESDVAVDALALDVVGIADDRRFRDLWMSDKRALDLGGAKTVAGDIDDIVDAAGNPIIAVFVAAAAIAGEIHARIGGEVDLLETIVVAV